MADLWFISDTHFGHANTFLKFKQPNGEPMRPFTSVEEMNETMIQRWNAVVKPQDEVYHLGDVVMKCNDPDAIMRRLNGHKRLVSGNHDTLDSSFYAKYFEKIYGARQLEHIWFTHLPVHPSSLGGKILGNVHGHLHNNAHRTERALPCPPYLNICVELIDYTPVSFDWVRRQLGI